jgi:hypothetical protein
MLVAVVNPLLFVSTTFFDMVFFRHNSYIMAVYLAF